MCHLLKSPGYHSWRPFAMDLLLVCIITDGTIYLHGFYLLGRAGSEVRLGQRPFPQSQKR